MKRPMLYWVISFVLGEVLAGRIPRTGMVIIILIFGVAVIKIKHAYIEKNRKLLFFGVLFFLLGFTDVALWSEKVNICEQQNVTGYSFKGRVIERTDNNGSYTYRLKCNRLNDNSVSVGMIIETDEVLILGSGVEGEGVRKDFYIAANPGQFDEKEYNYSQGILIRLKNVRVDHIKKPMLRIRQGLYEFRKKASVIISHYINDRYYSMATAMLLGEKSEIDKELKELYQRNGIAHLLAISGLHIAMLGGTLYQLIRKMTGSFVAAAILGGVFILMYGLLTGLSTATLRAVIMLIITIGADVLGRKYDGITGLSAALLLMLAGNPFKISQAGFLLSFGAVIGITCVYPIADEKVKGLIQKDMYKVSPKGFFARILDGLMISLSVQLVTIPVLLYYFYEFPVYSVLLNIIVVPLMSILLGSLIVVEAAGTFSLMLLGNGLFPVLIMGKILNAAACGAAKLADKIFEVYELLCTGSDKLPFHTICTGRPGTLWIIAYYSALLVCVLLLHFKKYYGCLTTFIILCCLWGSFLIPQPLKICMLDVGQGDGIYVRLPDGKGMMIDGGSSSEKNVGSYILKKGIKYYGSNHLKYCIVTHADSDHYSGILELINMPDIKIDNFILPYILNPDDAYIELCNAAKNKGCNVIFLKENDKILEKDVTFICLNPQIKRYDDKNTGSIVLWMNYGNFDMLFTGDMDSYAENSIMDNKEFIKSVEDGTHFEVLKVAHHGSDTSSSEAFLRMFRFDNALISVGKNNTYGHPSDKVLERLSKYCRQIYLTKESGAITIDTDGKKYRIRKFK